MRRSASAALALGVVPALFAAIYALLLQADDRLNWRMPDSTIYWLLVPLVLCGAALLWRSGVSAPWRIAITLGYCVAMMVVMFFIALFLECARGNCL